MSTEPASSHDLLKETDDGELLTDAFAAPSVDGPDAASRPQARAPGHSIVLVGLMGAGKTTIGRRLAGLLGLPFRDADAEIERAASCSIADLFARYGEAEFRDGERRVIRRLLAGPPIVLATGGGAYMDDETRALIRARARSVWLRCPLPVLLRRAFNDAVAPPPGPTFLSLPMDVMEEMTDIDAGHPSRIDQIGRAHV